MMNKRIACIAGILVACVLIAVILVRLSSRAPHIMFPGLREKSVLYHGWTECPNGDGTYMKAYQCHPVSATRWAAHSRRAGKNWIQGPVRDSRYHRAFWWGRTNHLENNGPPPAWPYEQWLRSEHFYFYLEYYEEFSSDGLSGQPHHSAIWALDSRSHRLYYVAGSM